MADMLEQTNALLAALQKPSTNVDQRLQLFNNLKSSIKHSRVPEEAQAPIFDCIRIAISATTSAALVSTGFSTLSHFIKRLQLQRETNVITSQSNKLCALLLDKLGDARESHRSAASVILGDLHNLCPAEVDAVIHGAMKGSNARAKDTSMSWVVRMNKHEGVPFRTYGTQLVANLEDADAGVRDTAKHAVVDLFSSAPEHAKANLMKQLIATNVRKTIATYITTHLDEGTVAVKEVDMPPPPPVARPIPAPRAATLQPDHGIAEAMAAEVPPPTETVSMDPLHIYTQRELEDMFRDMAPPFEGRESEHNWIPRDKNTTKLRRVLKGNAPEEFTAIFIAGIKSLLDGILKVANTLRTTMSTNGCLLVQELAKTLGHAIDPWVEILLQSFIKMCAATKNIAAQNGNVTVDAIISHASFSNRMLQHVSFAAQDKNVQPRSCSASWVKTLIRKHKAHIEHSGNMDTLEKILKKGVSDANPKVREAYRSTYWTFALVWPQRAEIMFETFEKREKIGLEKDPNNPHASLASSQNSTASFSKSVGAGAARNALKEKIAEQRRAKLAASKGVPERPTSAAATYTPAKSQSAKSLIGRTASNTSTASSASARPPSAMSGESTKSALKNSTGTGSLMSGTVRRPIRRPELPRPATADPYAVRRAAGGTGKTTPSMTPEKTPAATTAKKSVIPKSSTRPRSQTQNSPNVSPVRSKSRLGQSTTSRPAATGSRIGSPAASPAKDEDLTMVKPFVRSQSQHDPATIPFRQRNGMEKPSVIDSEAIDAGDEDNFTMVIPSLARPTAQATTHTPPKLTPSPGRLAAPSPRASALRSPKSMGDIPGMGLRSSTRSPRLRSPDRPSTRGTDAQDEVQVFEDPFIGEEPSSTEHELDKPVLGELPINEKNNERRMSNSSTTSDPMMGNASEDRPRGHYKTTSSGSVLYGDNDANNAEVMKNRQLLASGIRKIEGRTVEAHMFRRMQDMVKSNQDIWGANNENFGRLLLACLEFLQTPTEELKTTAMKAANLKVQALATIRAMLALYRRETAKYFSRVLCAILQTKSQYENTSHIANDLETTADEIVRYGQTLDCLNAVLSLVEDTPTSTPASSPNSKSSSSPVAAMSSTRTTTMALTTLASLIEISGIKNINLTPDQTSRLGKLAVRCLNAQDADVRKADIELCVALHERIVGPGAQCKDDGFWKAVAGAQDQHLNLLTYYLAKKGKA